MEEFQVRAYETDPGGELRLVSLINYMEEAAWRNSHALGYSVNHLLERGVSWVMQRMKLDVMRWPHHNDTVYVDTWPSGLDRLLTYRDFKLYGASKELIATAKTNWIVLDMASRKMIRIPEFIKEARFSIEKDNLPLMTNKIVRQDALDEIMKYQVMERDIDRNEHVNNAYYLQWCLAGQSDEMRKSRLSSIDVTFKSESLLGDQLTFYRKSLGEHRYQHLISNSVNGKDVIIAETTFGSTV